MVDVIIDPSRLAHLQDHSIRFHDTSTLPHLPRLSLHLPHIPFRRPRPPTRPLTVTDTILHHVKSSPVQSAAFRLRHLIIQSPPLAPVIVNAILKHLLPPPPRFFSTKPYHHINPARPVILLYHLVASIPYFYRYIATPTFFRALWRLEQFLKHSPHTRTQLPLMSVRILIAAWSRDLSHMRLHNDPAALFWISTYNRLCKQIYFPTPPTLRFVNRVVPVVASCHLYHKYNSKPCIFSANQLSASLALIDQLDMCANPGHAHNQTPSATSHVSLDHLSVPDTVLPDPRPNPQRRKRGKEKFLSVLRRHDDICGRTDPYYFSPPTHGDEDSGKIPYSRISRSSASTVSVAAVAKENARRKLDQSRSTLSLSWSVPGYADLQTDNMQAFLEGITPDFYDSREGERAVTPSTFADLNNMAYGDYVMNDDENPHLTASYGDTVVLPSNYEYGSWSGGESQGNTVVIPEGYDFSQWAGASSQTDFESSEPRTEQPTSSIAA